MATSVCLWRWGYWQRRELGPLEKLRNLPEVTQWEQDAGLQMRRLELLLRARVEEAACCLMPSAGPQGCPRDGAASCPPASPPLGSLLK